MSAKAQMKDMLDQLMGTQRDGIDPNSVSFRDEEVCKTFLLGCCPHEILSGTRCYIATRNFCKKFLAFEHLTRFISDTDQKIEVSKKKLAEQQAEISAEVKEKEDAVQALEDKINEMLADAERLGSEGEVEQAKEKLDEIENVKVEKAQAEENYRNSMPASTYQQQKLRVCDVCSAYLGLHDNDTRLADHFAGKLHLGFIEIREQHQKLKKKVEEERGNIDLVKERRMTEAREAEERKRSRTADSRRDENGRGHRGSYDRNSYDRRRRSRSSERRRRRSRSRSRDRHRRRSRSRSRDGRRHCRRSRSRERYRR